MQEKIIIAGMLEYLMTMAWCHQDATAQRIFGLELEMLYNGKYKISS